MLARNGQSPTELVYQAGDWMLISTLD